MTNQVHIGGRNSATQGAQGGQKSEEAQLEDRDFSSVSRIQTRPNSRISGSNSLISRTTVGAGSPNPETASNPDLEHSRQLLEGGIRRAFFGTTDGIDGGTWDSVRTGLSTMTLGEARGICQTIANEVAVDCFDGDGHVDGEKLQTWMELLGNAEIFREEPFCLIPHAELMRSQMYTVCESIVSNRNEAKNLLNAAADIPVGLHGQSLLDIISNGRQPPLCPSEAILASLFSPPRQMKLPMCTMYSFINAEIRNHTGQLMATYMQMIIGDQFTFQSGYTVRMQPVVNGYITLDLGKTKSGREALANLMSKDPAIVTQQTEAWLKEEVECTPSTNSADQFRLKMRVRNMNDVLFTHFIRESSFGNGNIGYDENFGTTRISAGHNEYSTIIRVDGSNFLPVIAELKEQGEAQKRLGHHYMRVATQSSRSAHGENIDIDALLALNPDTMEIEKAYPIGDRNWAASDMSQD
ncbi:MAG: hypothetical protein LBF49_00335, partial [Puniceicoccales bacterium]|nr:hypothetical protein [Puniceicoccales bacterium]